MNNSCESLCLVPIDESEARDEYVLFDDTTYAVYEAVAKATQQLRDHRDGLEEQVEFLDEQLTRAQQNAGKAEDRAITAKAEVAASLHTIMMQAEKIDTLGIDTVTDLLTRGAWQSKACQLLKTPGRYFIVLADLDHFKRVNDLYGHDEGDRTLHSTGKAGRKTLHDPELPHAIRDEILIGRYGGEEIVAIIRARDDDPNYAERLATSFITETNKIKYPKTYLKGQEISESSQGLSIGLMEFSSNGQNVADRLRLAIKYADAALYKAKHDGRNQLHVYKQGMTPVRRSRGDGSDRLT